MEGTNEKWALITGATSGLGEAYARLLASMGYSLILTGRRKEALMPLAESLKATNYINVEVILGDLSDNKVVEQIVDGGSKVSELSFLICNAGFGNKIDFFDDTIQSQELMIEVHINATVQLCHALAPKIIKPPKTAMGGIILVSSLGSFFSSPNAILYCSTKAFLNSFAKSLALALYGRGIPVQALCPGFTRTQFHSKLNIPSETLKNRGFIRWMEAEKVVLYSLKRLKLGKVIVIPGFFNRILKFVGNLLPFWLYLKIVAGKGTIFKK